MTLCDTLCDTLMHLCRLELFIFAPIVTHCVGLSWSVFSDLCTCGGIVDGEEEASAYAHAVGVHHAHTEQTSNG